jgi:hypothetical protein
MGSLHSPHLPPYFTLAISGQTKLNRNSGATFKIPCVATTQGTGLEPGKWLARHLSVVAKEGRTDGYLFSKRGGKRSYLSDFQEDFFWPLEELQSGGNKHLEVDCDIWEEYGIWRYLRRGVTAHTINRKVDDRLIHTINRWRNDKSNQGKGAPMMDIYAELEALLPTALNYSLAL